jgi:hypothetical protein
MNSKAETVRFIFILIAVTFCVLTTGTAFIDGFVQWKLGRQVQIVEVERTPTSCTPTSSHH